GFGEAGPRMLNQKGDSTAMRTATKAMVKLLGGADCERWCFFFMEGAEAKQIGSALTELHISPHDVDDVDPGEEILYEGFWYQSIQTRRQLLAANTLVMTLDRGGAFALAFCGGLLVVFTRTQLGQETIFLNSALEAAKR